MFPMEFREFTPFLLFAIAQLIALGGFITTLINRRFSKLEDLVERRITNIEGEFNAESFKIKEDIKEKMAMFHGIATGESCSYARKNSGEVWSWGQNLNGVLGDWTTTDRSSPVAVADTV